MKITDLKESDEKTTLQEAHFNTEKLTLHGIDSAQVNDFDSFSNYVQRLKITNPTLYRKIMSLD